MMGIKQEALAAELGVDWSQKKVSMLEAQESIEETILKQVAEILKVSPEAIKNFDEQSAITYINTFNDGSFPNNNGAVANGTGYQDCNFNPLDKLMEALEENKALDERLLKSEQEKVELLKQQIK